MKNISFVGFSIFTLILISTSLVNAGTINSCKTESLSKEKLSCYIEITKQESDGSWKTIDQTSEFYPEDLPVDEHLEHNFELGSGYKVSFGQIEDLIICNYTAKRFTYVLQAPNGVSAVSTVVVEDYYSWEPGKMTLGVGDKTYVEMRCKKVVVE